MTLETISRTTPLSDDQPSPDTLRLGDAEAKMRRALGLDGEQPRPQPPQPAAAERLLLHRPKRRFVADGEVPVVHGRLSRRDESPMQAPPATNRVEAAESAARAEREARDKTERLLTEAQATIHDLQTRLGHAQLAGSEAQRAIENERATIASLREALSDAGERLATVTAEKDAALRELRHMQAALAEARKPAERSAKRAVAPPPFVVVKRGRPPKAIKPAVQSRDTVAKPAKTIAKRPGRPAKTQAEQEPVRWWIKSSARTKRR